MRYLLGILLVVLTSSAFAEAPSYRTLTWDDLMPAGEWDHYEKLVEDYFTAPIEEGSAQDQSIQFGTYNVVASLDGQKVRVPGFVLPFEFGLDQTVSEFLLVPYFGACIHSPPPPPNQIVYVTMDKPVRFDDIWTPIWASGVLETKKNLNAVGNAAYTLRLESWEIYELDE